MLRLVCAVSATVINAPNFSKVVDSRRYVTHTLTQIPEHLSDYEVRCGCFESKVQELKLQKNSTH
jgi:hypothetical protein